LLSNGAVILDVRTTTEFKTGHIAGSINIPLEQLSKNISKIKKDKPIITCCASGVRSSIARSVLIKNGFIHVYNGGGFAKLKEKLNK
jgi:rhodanese-related sulfurtransferase